MLVSRLAATVFTALSLSAAQAADCPALLSQHLAGDLSLAFDAFDQESPVPGATKDCHLSTTRHERLKAP